MDYHLRFEPHVANTIRKAIINLKMIYNMRSLLNNKQKVYLCDSLVLSIYKYVDSVYGPCVDFSTPRRTPHSAGPLARVETKKKAALCLSSP